MKNEFIQLEAGLAVLALIMFAWSGYFPPLLLVAIAALFLMILYFVVDIIGLQLYAMWTRKRDRNRNP